MHTAGLSRAVVVRASPARHCFLSLPRHWASFILPTRTPTFILEVSQGRTVALSWAGDIHSAGEGDCKDEVYISGVVLRGCGVGEGEAGVLTQVPPPPPVSDLTVTVEAVSQWQDLALNAEGAQSTILSQVRVVGVGQGVPLWLAGGACVTLRVLTLTPDLPRGILQPMTRVEVLPPPDSEEGQTSASVTFNPQDAELLEDSEDPHSTIGSPLTSHAAQEDKDSQDTFYTSIFSYMHSKLREQKVKCNIPRRKDLQLGFRVIPVPESLSSEALGCEGMLLSHPSLIIVSQVSLSSSAFKDESAFLARVRRINSPRENAESASHSGEETKLSEENKTSNKPGSNIQVTCTVIVWENFIATRNIKKCFLSEVNSVLRGNNCVVPNSLRRLLKLSVLSVIEMETGDVTTESMPVRVDVLPLAPLEDSKARAVCEEVRERLKNLTNEFIMVVNPDTLLELSHDGNIIDVLVRTRGEVPLLLTSMSVALLDITLLGNSQSNLPYIQGTVDELNKGFCAKHSFLGDQSVFKKLKDHITLSLTNVSGGLNALVQGSRGSGKTSLIESLVECLSSFPHHLHCDVVPFKQLRGKKAETVERRLQLVFREAIFHSPSLIVLEDLDFLVAAQEQESGPAHEHTLQLVTLLQGLLNQLAEVVANHGAPHHSKNPPGHSSLVVVLATCVSRTSVHPLLVNPQGCHYFPCTFPIPPLDSAGRLSALKLMLQSHMMSYKEHHRSPLQVASGNNTLGVTRENESEESPQIQIDAKDVSRRMENFVLPDLSHMALRTFLQAKRRWQEEELHAGCDKRVPNKSPLVVSSNATGTGEKCVSSSSGSAGTTIVMQDVKAALDGYTPLALRGVTLSEESQDKSPEVGGLSEAQRILEETLAWPARYPQLLGQVQMRLRSGVLLYGPPGSGKTRLAHTVAATCKLNFITVKGPELLSKYIGASEAAVREAFERASQARPCVLFFDEFESVGGVRGRDSTGVTDRVVNQLLTQLDGAEEVAGVSVLAATSRPDLIDPALLRPGRLDKCVLCPLPSETDRCEILQVLAKGVPLGEVVDWTQVARQTRHFSGADLQSLLATAQIIVAQETFGADLYQGVISPDQDLPEEPVGVREVQGEENNVNQGACDIEGVSKHDKGLQNDINSFSDPKNIRVQKASKDDGHITQKKLGQHKDSLSPSETIANDLLTAGYSEGEIYNKINEKDIQPHNSISSHCSTPCSSNQEDLWEAGSERNSVGKEGKSVKHRSDVSTGSSIDSERTGARPKFRSMLQEQVVIEKEQSKVRYNQRRAHVPEENVYDKDENGWSIVQQETLPGDASEKHKIKSSIISVDSRDEMTSHMYKENKSHPNTQESHSQPQTQEPDFNVYQRHIDAALREVWPSVSAEDRQKYRQLYATFTQSREGNFGQPTPGERATMA